MEMKLLSTRELILLSARRFLPFLVGLAALFFLTAGTLAYWQAWLYLAILISLMLSMMSYLIRTDPALLQRRMQTRERETPQKRIVAVSLLVFLVAFGLPGLDFRFGWSRIPLWGILAANAFVILGYGLFIWVMRTNSYASRVIEVAAGQKVIDSGPYAILRHPMYSATLILYFASMLALGSYWALIPMTLYLPLLAVRIKNEEAVLRKDLPGYVEYCQKVRWRLLPGIW